MYFLPLPQGHGSFRFGLPMLSSYWACAGLSSGEVAVHPGRGQSRAFARPERPPGVLPGPRSCVFSCRAVRRSASRPPAEPKRKTSSRSRTSTGALRPPAERTSQSTLPRTSRPAHRSSWTSPPRPLSTVDLPPFPTEVLPSWLVGGRKRRPRPSRWQPTCLGFSRSRSWRRPRPVAGGSRCGKAGSSP